MSSTATSTGAPAGTSSDTTSRAAARPRSPAFHRAREKNECARSCGHSRDSPAPDSIPQTVRFPRLGKETAGQAGERAERRGGEQRRESGQQRHQRRRHRGIREHRQEARFLKGSGRGHGRPPPAIMESMPQTPGEQARNAVTARITAHVAAGWPRLGPPEVRFRGRYCYVAVTLPGHRSPTPFLRLRWQGSPDEWAIGIYKATTETVQRKRVPLVLRPAHRHARAGNRRDPRPLRRPAGREVITPTRQPQNCESRGYQAYVYSKCPMVTRQ